jgi:hypothetical protein
MQRGCAAVLVLAAAGCFSPDPRPGLPCTEDRRCPEGQTCDSEGVCRRSQSDAGGSGDGGCADLDRRATLELRLFASEPGDGDNLGEAMAISGVWLAVSARNDDEGGDNAGAVYLFERVGTDWMERQKLTASDAVASAQFGTAVALEDTTLVVGAPEAGDPVSGRAYVFELEGGTWMERQILLGAGGAPGDGFGSAVALSGTHLAVGAPDAVTGAIFTFDHNGSSWLPEDDFIPGDQADGFGAALAVDDTTLAVGAPRDDDEGESSGSVFLFTRSGSAWISSGKLTASDGAANDAFGTALALAGGRLLVGAPFRGDVGGVYAFEGTSFATERVIQADDSAAGDSFGLALAAAGDLVAVGASADDDGGTSVGSLYLFASDGDAWTQLDKLTDPEGAEFDTFGSSMTLGADSLVVGAPLHDRAGGPANAGAAIVYSVACP